MLSSPAAVYNPVGRTLGAVHNIFIEENSVNRRYNNERLNFSALFEKVVEIMVVMVSSSKIQNKLYQLYSLKNE